MFATIEHTLAGLEPGGTAHDLAYQLEGIIRKDYKGHVASGAHMIYSAVRSACDLIQEIENMDNASIDSAPEVKAVNRIFHLIS